MNRKSTTTAAAAVSIAVVLAACTAQSSDDTSPSAGTTGGPSGTAAVVTVTFDPEAKKLVPDVPASDWCGKKQVKMAVADGVSFNKWRQIAFAVIKKQAAQCPAVSPDIKEVSANGDQQKAISDINTLVAQGIDLIIINADFGQAQLPAIKAAHRAGVAVVPYVSAVGGTPGVDYVAATIEDGQATGKELTTSVAKYLKGKGNVIFLGGNAGAPSSQAQFDGAMVALKDFPDVKMLVDAPVATNWAEPDAQKAVAGLIAKYPKIDAVYTDYGPTAIGAVNAFVAAGRKPPVIATVASGNQLGCVWEKFSTTPNKFEFFSADSTHAMPMAGAQQGIAAATGGKFNPNQMFILPIVYDTPAGKNPVCDKSLPVDADFTSPLDTTELAAALNQ
jgi:ribose transport system substrate-binding protein